MRKGEDADWVLIFKQGNISKQQLVSRLKARDFFRDQRPGASQLDARNDKKPQLTKGLVRCSDVHFCAVHSTKTLPLL